jgi:hypothetical protein
MGIFNSVQESRLKKTKLLFEQKDLFFTILYKELRNFVRRAKKANKHPVVRLNGTSDLDWNKLKPGIYNDFPEIQWVEYTKNYKRYQQWLAGEFGPKTHFLFSRSETNEQICKDVLSQGGNVAVVFHRRLPKKFWGYQVINGTRSDLRFLDKRNTICGLIASGRARKDQTGFVIRDIK